jgi:autophagy-related protein 11
MRYQQSALRVASTALDRRVLDISNVFDDVAAGTRQGLDEQVSLIASVNPDIELASRIQIHPVFLSLTASWAMGACGPARTPGYDILGERMHQVVDACQRTHGVSYMLLLGSSGAYIREG